MTKNTLNFVFKARIIDFLFSLSVTCVVESVSVYISLSLVCLNKQLYA